MQAQHKYRLTRRDVKVSAMALMVDENAIQALHCSNPAVWITSTTHHAEEVSNHLLEAPAVFAGWRAFGYRARRALGF